MRDGRRLCCALVLFTAGALAPLLAQGEFVNLETPQTQPIATAVLGTGALALEVVLVCNTPDNSLEVYEAAPPHAFLARVPTGLGPATVRFNAALGRAYTCNFDGDSVSVIRLQLVGGAVQARLERTVNVGDEPSDIVFDPANQFAAVSLNSQQAVFVGSSLTLAPFVPQFTLEAADPALPGIPLAVKNPRQLEWRADGRVFALNFQGGNPDPSTAGFQYEMDLWYLDGTNPVPMDFVAGMGTTNQAFAMTEDGSRMFVVGTTARNFDAIGEAAVSQIATGFVRSFLWVLDTPLGVKPTVRPEAIAGVLPAPQFRSLDLNRDYGVFPGVGEVGPAEALSQPTDVKLLEGPGGVQKIFVTAYHSDRVAVLKPSAVAAGGYLKTIIDLPIIAPTEGYGMVGPRAMALSRAAVDPSNGGHLLFVLGRNDNTVHVINAGSETRIGGFQLAHDPTPEVIRFGRQFLYGAKFSGSGFVACASCHIDARADDEPWDLGVVAAGPNIPKELHDGNGQDLTTMPEFPEEKGPMVTQTLQGLVNSEVNPLFQVMFTNAPYHWRGDRASFRDFNGAFVGLQGMPPQTPTNPVGLSEADMVAYERFINTVAHPPNPRQRPDRIPTGSLGPNPNDPTAATGARLGMLLYHDFPAVGARSCVDCHSLPDGSSNTATLTFPVSFTISGAPGNQQHPFESAAIRNIERKNMIKHASGALGFSHVMGNSGMLHPGEPSFLTSFSVNSFVQLTFMGQMPGPNVTQQIDALTEFVLQFDSGLAPAIGVAHTVVPGNPALDMQMFDLLEGQVEEANAGLAVYTRNGGVEKGYWYDNSLTPAGYREEGTANLISRAQLIALATGPGNTVVAQGVPLGSDRRIASLNGVAAPLTGPTASNLVLEPMAPNTFYADVSQFNLNLNLGQPPTTSIWTQRTLQQSVVGSFGVPAVRHEPPRRFRVTGDDIRPGAQLWVALPTTSPGQAPFQVMMLDLFATQHTKSGRRIWESVEELDATMTFAMLNGGLWAPDVVNTLRRCTTTPALDPQTWNQFLVAVVNADATIGIAPSWQPLTIQDGR